MAKSVKNKHALPKLLYRRDEAAFTLGLGLTSIDEMIADGRLSTRKWGRATLIPAADVERAAKTILESDMPGRTLKTAETRAA